MNFRLVFAIAIVSVLFSSGITLQEVYADHLHQRGGAAYMFDCSGAAGGNFAHWQEVRTFVQQNNGVYHACGYNWINQAFIGTTEKSRTGAFINQDCNPGETTRTGKDCYNGNPVNHDIGDTPFGWFFIIFQYFTVVTTKIPDIIFPNDNIKLILRRNIWDVGVVMM